MYSYGALLRANRQGFYWYEPYKRFIRIGVTEDSIKQFRVDVCTENDVPILPLNCKKYYFWWDSSNFDFISNMNALTALVNACGGICYLPEYHFWFFIDDDSNLVPSKTGIDTDPKYVGVW